MKPKEEQFLELLRQHASLTAAAGEVMYAALTEGRNAEESYERVRALRKEARPVMENLKIRLYKTWKEDLQRDQVKELLQSMDDEMGEVKSMVGAFSLYSAGAPSEAMKTMTALAFQSLDEVRKMMDYTVSLSENAMKMEARRQKVETYEQRGDRCYREEMKRLFQEKKDPFYVMQWKDILLRAEHILDAAVITADSLGKTVEPLM